MLRIQDSAVRGTRVLTKEAPPESRIHEGSLNRERAILLGRVFIAIPMVAFGVQHLVYGEFVTRAIHRFPSWVPLLPLMAYLTGAGLIAGGAGMLLRKRLAAVSVATALFLSFLLLAFPHAISGPFLGGLWTNAFKALAMSGGAFLVADTLSESGRHRSGVERLIPFSRFFFASFLILGGIQHFLFADFVATLVPSWIPGHYFWTYFAGIALIAGGIGIMVPLTTRLAATLTAIMIFLWVILLHIPRAMADLRNSNETTAVFEAIAMTGVAILVSVQAQTGDRRAG